MLLECQGRSIPGKSGFRKTGTLKDVKNRFCERFGLMVPVVQAPIGSASCPELVAAVSNAVFRMGADFVDSGGVPVDPPIDPSVIVRVMPTPAIQYSGGWFDDLGDDEVLVIEGTMPQCRYLSIQLLTRR